MFFFYAIIDSGKCSMKLISFNLKNVFLQEMNKEKVSFISNFIKNNNIDIVNVQELSVISKRRLKKVLHNYSFYGEFRYRKMFSLLPMNENNNIITNKKVEDYETIRFKDKLLYKITHFPLLPRIATITIISDMCIINTHISNRVKKVKDEQLESLKKVIDKYKNYRIILTGDFNMTSKNETFNDFIKYLDNLNITRVPLNEPTWYGRNKKYTLDHVFISKNIVLKDYKILSSNNYSDHDILYIETN